MITHVYTARRDGEEYIEMARDVNPTTGKERLLERYELEDPDGVEVGDEAAFKVSLFNQGPLSEDGYRP